MVCKGLHTTYVLEWALSHRTLAIWASWIAAVEMEPVSGRVVMGRVWNAGGHKQTDFETPCPR